MNNKGFMMAEVIVVSVIIMTALSGLYISYSKIYNRYSEILNYYDAGALYRLGYYRDTLIENDELNNYLYTSPVPVRKIVNGDVKVGDTVFLVHNNSSQLTEQVINEIIGYEINKTYEDYLYYIKESVDLRDTNYVMIIESCEDIDNCKYGYISVNDGNES